MYMQLSNCSDQDALVYHICSPRSATLGSSVVYRTILRPFICLCSIDSHVKLVRGTFGFHESSGPRLARRGAAHFASFKTP